MAIFKVFAFLTLWSGGATLLYNYKGVIWFLRAKNKERKKSVKNYLKMNKMRVKSQLLMNVDIIKWEHSIADSYADKIVDKVFLKAGIPVCDDCGKIMSKYWHRKPYQYNKRICRRCGGLRLWTAKL